MIPFKANRSKFVIRDRAAKLIRHSLSTAACAFVLCSVTSSPASAMDTQSIETVRVWYSSMHQVVEDDMALPPNVQLEVMDVALVEKGEQMMNRWINERVQWEQDPQANAAKMTQAANAFTRAPEFEQMKTMIESGAYAMQSAIYNKLTKVPAIVFNDRYVVYGVTSIREAVEIFRRKAK